MSIHKNYPHDGEDAPFLDPGFHFPPTDEELVSHYLAQKAANRYSVFQAIGDVDFSKCEPWELPAMAKAGDQSIFYFFSLNDRKYPTGMRTNRATRAGYWKSTGRDREVMTGMTGELLGMKKILVFYTGRAPKLGKTNWIMHEYRLPDESTSDNKQWVVCKVFEKKLSDKRAPATSHCNGGYNVECSTDQLSSFLPARPGLESRSSNFVKSNTLSEPQGRFHDVTSLAAPRAAPETILKQSDTAQDAALQGSLDLDLVDTLVENLISGWDMGSPEPIWELGVHDFVP